MRTSHKAKDAAAEKQSYACDTWRNARKLPDGHEPQVFGH
jgi:hypothetical protein